MESNAGMRPLRARGFEHDTELANAVLKAPPKTRRRPAPEKVEPATGTAKTVQITPPKFERAAIRVVGISPFVQNKFSQKARNMIEETQRQGSRAKKGRQREARDFDADYKAAMHVSREGWIGIPAPAFRSAMISACRTVGFAMTRAKLSVFVEPDGYDREDGTPLVRIEGTPHPKMDYVRNESGVVDLRCRPVFDEWSAVVNLRWDADQFSAEDILNLLARAGLQVGVGEGRPDSPNSYGQGFGLWEIAT